MLLNILYGGIGSGKSSMLYSLITQNLKNNPKSNAILLVPEQFSHTADKTINEIVGGQGPNRVEVLTFSRLISRYIDQSNDLLPSGKIMLILKSLSNLNEDNMFISSSNRAGFISSCGELFSEFKRYMITPEDIMNVPSDSPATSAKLRSVSEIYENYQNAFNDNFTDSDDAVVNFAEFIKSRTLFSDTFFYIDDYSDFLPQHYALISSLISHSLGVYITLGMGDDSDLFAPVLKAKSRLEYLGQNLGADVTVKKLTKEPDYIKSSEIRFLLDNWNNHNEYEAEASDIHIYKNSDPYSEVENLAGKIISLVRDKGMRFKDIGVICGDSERYRHLAGAIFSDYNIPYFTDEKMPVSLHPISRTVLSLFDIISDNWSYQSVFSYLHSGYIYDENITPINNEDVDMLENYVLKYGIKGKKAWFSDFTKGGETVFDDVIDSHKRESFDLDSLNNLRRKIVAPFEKFLENKSRTGAKIAEAFFGFLNDINLYEGILSECQRFDEDGKRDESEQFKKVWNCILQVLDQVVITSGKEVLSRDVFANMIKCGLSQCGISIIPSGVDRVTLGTVQKNSPSRVKALFIIGANQGLIPPEPNGGSIITDSDRIVINSSLSQIQKEIAPDDTQKLMLENLKLYRAVSGACENLFISYPVMDESGVQLSPSDFVNNIKLKFPLLSTKNTTQTENNEQLASRKRGFYYMLAKLSEYNSENPDKLWYEVKNWYESNPEYKERMDFLEAAAEYRKIKPRLSLEKAALLYGQKKKYSITALEKFSQCPFAYYMSYGLYARPRETTKVQKSHLGSLIHYAVCEYCRHIENGADSVSEIRSNWEALTKEKSLKIISGIMKDVRSKVLTDSGEEQPRLEYLLSRCEKNLKNSCENIRQSIQKGDYAVASCEKEFQVDIKYKNDSVSLIGTIDRIDVAEDENGASIRIVDYKSGYKKFSLTSILNKLDMQLVLYAQAALNMYKDGTLEAVNRELDPRICAVFYNKINEDTVSLPVANEDLAKEEIKKAEKLDGRIVLDEENALLSLSNIYAMDRDFEKTSKSDFLRVSLLKSGELKKNSQVISRKDFDTVSKYLKKTAIEADRDIHLGNIDVAPYIKGSESACTFCDYKQICMFDEDIDPARIGYPGKGDPIEIMEKVVNEDE